MVHFCFCFYYYIRLYRLHNIDNSINEGDDNETLMVGLDPTELIGRTLMNVNLLDQHSNILHMNTNCPSLKLFANEDPHRPLLGNGEIDLDENLFVTRLIDHGYGTPYSNPH